MPFQAGGHGGENLADDISARVQTELGGAPRGVCELLGVELGGVQLRGCLDAIDEGGRAVAEAELAARVEQAGELAGLDVARVFPDRGRGGGEQRIDARGGGAGERAAAVGGFRQALERGAAVDDVELVDVAVDEVQHVRGERTTRELLVELHLTLAHRRSPRALTGRGSSASHEHHPRATPPPPPDAMSRVTRTPAARRERATRRDDA